MSAEEARGPWKPLLDALAENATKAPGWLPLLILCYVAFMLLPEGTNIFGFHLKSHEELIVPGVTLALYVLGDLLDKLLFKSITRRWLEEDQKKAKKALELEDGIYRVSKALAIAAKNYEGSWRVKNESAKFLRSLVIPSAGLGFVLVVRSQVALGITAVAAGILFFLFYIWLKASHIKDLYRLSEKVVCKRDCNGHFKNCKEGCGDDCKEHFKYEACNLSDRVRLFFWDGELVGSGNRRDPAKDDTLANTPCS